MKNLIQSFKFRKIALAMADAFIIAVSSFITDFFIEIPRKAVGISVVLSVISCFFALFVCGAYNTLW